MTHSECVDKMKATDFELNEYQLYAGFSDFNLSIE